MNQRLLKFRAWDKKRKTMIYIQEVADWHWFGGVVLVQNDVYDILEFTGLHDKNSKEIWEGDIIDCPCGRGEMTYLNALGHYMGSYGWGEDGAFFSLHIDRHGVSRIEVIGNIYENPDLLTHSNK